MPTPMTIHAWSRTVTTGALCVCFAAAYAQTPTPYPQAPYPQTSGPNGNPYPETLNPRPIGPPASPTSTLRLVSETPIAARQTAAPLSADELAELAVDAYVYAYPMVLMEVTRRMQTNVGSASNGRAPMNQFGNHATFPDARTADAYWPSTDGVYSNLWYDVSRNPLIISIPGSGGRYQLFTFMDMWSDQFATLGTRTTGNGAQQIALVGPYWHGVAPANTQVIRSPTGTGWIIGRIQVGGPTDLPEANRLQAGLSASAWAPMTASTLPMRTSDPAYPGSPSAANSMPPAYGVVPVMTPAVNPDWDMSTPPAQQVARMSAAQFFTLFAQVEAANPPHANDYPIQARLRRIGLGENSRVFNFGQLDPAVQQALTDAAPIASHRITEALGWLAPPVNEWITVLDGIGTYGTDYTRRAAIAYAGLGANTPEDVVYPVTMFDADGKPLDGDHKYTLHFDKGQLPPVNAFWSLMIYNSNHAFIDNPAHRYAIRSTDPLHYNSDGSLDIVIQNRDPGADRRTNWLPTPKEGNFILNMRLYSPKSIVLDGSWAPPAVRR